MWFFIEQEEAEQSLCLPFEETAEVGQITPEEPVRKITAKQRVDFPAARNHTRKSWTSRKAYHRNPS